MKSNNLDKSAFYARLIENDHGKEVLEFLDSFDLSNNKTAILDSSTLFNIKKASRKKIKNFINLKKINDIRYINKYFEFVNDSLPIGGKIFGCVETYPNRRKAIFKKYPPIINFLVYIIDFIFKRIFPKLKITKKIYFYFTRGKNRAISRAETYGRLYSCGFEILQEKRIKNILYFIFKKTKLPSYDKDPTYGPIIRLKRIGKDKKFFKVYKLRTMYPFSEHLQEYVYLQNDLKDGGKIKDDFRISPEGRIFRKFWLDEIPMIINILKGDLKIVGVRPLSPHFFSLYSKELQDLRTKVKPGFIPPFYVDLPQTIEEVMNSEKKYLEMYMKSPIRTDIKYLLISLYNVFFKGARSG